MQYTLCRGRIGWDELRANFQYKIHCRRLIGPQSPAAAPSFRVGIQRLSWPISLNPQGLYSPYSCSYCTCRTCRPGDHSLHSSSTFQGTNSPLSTPIFAAEPGDPLRPSTYYQLPRHTVFTAPIFVETMLVLSRVVACPVACLTERKRSVKLSPTAP